MTESQPDRKPPTTQFTCTGVLKDPHLTWLQCLMENGYVENVGDLNAADEQPEAYRFVVAMAWCISSVSLTSFKRV